MDHFQLSIQKRIFSRLAFYSVVFLILWLMGRVAPGDNYGNYEAVPTTDEELGVAKAYFGVTLKPFERLGK